MNEWYLVQGTTHRREATENRKAKEVTRLQAVSNYGADKARVEARAQKNNGSIAKEWDNGHRSGRVWWTIGQDCDCGGLMTPEEDLSGAFMLCDTCETQNYDNNQEATNQ